MHIKKNRVTNFMSSFCYPIDVTLKKVDLSSSVCRQGRLLLQEALDEACRSGNNVWMILDEQERFNPSFSNVFVGTKADACNYFMKVYPHLASFLTLQERERTDDPLFMRMGKGLGQGDFPYDFNGGVLLANGVSGKVSVFTVDGSLSPEKEKEKQNATEILQYIITERLNRTISKLTGKAMSLYCKTPEGTVVDADTILADVMEDLEWSETGIGHDLLHTIQHAKSKEELQGMAKMFKCLTDMELKDFLQKCVDETTRETALDQEEELE